MTRNTIYLLVICFSGTEVQAQTPSFVTKGKIEFEVKVNQKKVFSETYGKEAGAADLLDNFPDFDIYYYNLTFLSNTSLYAPGRISNSPIPDKGSIFIENTSRKVVAKKNIFGSAYAYTDTLSPIKWRIQNETRKIAGFECRKAVGRLPGDVYIVAFYTLEILPQGGPELFSGLPGMILGAAVPQWHATWFATKLELTGFNEAAIKSPHNGKGKLPDRQETSANLMKEYSSYFNERFTSGKFDSSYFNPYRL